MPRLKMAKSLNILGRMMINCRFFHQTVYPGAVLTHLQVNQLERMILVVYLPTPLKNDGVSSSVGMMTFPYTMENKIHVPNHQPDQYTYYFRYPKKSSISIQLGLSNTKHPQLSDISSRLCSCGSPHAFRPLECRCPCHSGQPDDGKAKRKETEEFKKINVLYVFICIYICMHAY